MQLEASAIMTSLPSSDSASAAPPPAGLASGEIVPPVLEAAAPIYSGRQAAGVAPATPVRHAAGSAHAAHAPEPANTAGKEVLISFAISR